MQANIGFIAKKFVCEQKIVPMSTVPYCVTYGFESTTKQRPTAMCNVSGNRSGHTGCSFKDVSDITGTFGTTD